MEYRKEVTEGDKTTYETFEGTPEEILQLMNMMPQELKCEGFNQGISIEPMTHATHVGLIAEKIGEMKKKQHIK